MHKDEFEHESNRYLQYLVMYSPVPVSWNLWGEVVGKDEGRGRGIDSSH
jgi:hypothetical protein